jgi:hypothetical protein
MTPPDPLSDLLRAWRHEPPEAPGFQSGVWARLNAGRELSRFDSLQRWALPLAAGLALLAGTGAAVREAHRRDTDRMAAAFVRTVDPLQMSGGAQP